ncbi:MAG: serine/threonine-protein kinase [Planctomycetota bacterium]
MNGDLEMDHGGLADEAEFEASLISDIDPELLGAKTEITEPYEAPPKRPEPAPAKKRPVWAGKILGHFKLLRLIGEGKMGRVIQAHDINLHRIVALKILRKRIPGMEEQGRVGQFLREARAAAQIEHPNVVRIFEINQHDGWWYIAMEMLEGENLRDLIKATGPLALNRACTLIADAATALAVAHDLGIIHRDIKPTNLMLTRHGRCKLTDFGLVRLGDPNDPFDFTNKAVGSPQFMAPEVISRLEQTPAIDIYSLGATLYYILTGKPPYTGGKLEEILKKHLDAPVPDIRRELPECPASLGKLIQRAMAKKPTDRPTAADFAASLRAELIMFQHHGSGLAATTDSSIIGLSHGSTLLTTLPASTSAEPVPERLRRLAQTLKSRWALWLTAGAAAIVVAAIVLLMSFGSRTGETAGRGEDAELSAFFPGAPDTYGVLPPGATPESAGPAADRPPPFSWVGKVGTAGSAFVASKSGRYFYPIDDPAATLIAKENVVMYNSAADARKDGKIPTP